MLNTVAVTWRCQEPSSGSSKWRLQTQLARVCGCIAALSRFRSFCNCYSYLKRYILPLIRLSWLLPMLLVNQVWYIRASVEQKLLVRFLVSGLSHERLWQGLGNLLCAYFPRDAGAQILGSDWLGSEWLHMVSVELRYPSYWHWYLAAMRVKTRSMDSWDCFHFPDWCLHTLVLHLVQSFHA